MRLIFIPPTEPELVDTPSEGATSSTLENCAWLAQPVCTMASWLAINSMALKTSLMTTEDYF